MTPDPAVYDPEALGLHFQHPWDVLEYHPAPAPEPITPEEKNRSAALVRYHAKRRGEFVKKQNQLPVITDDMPESERKRIQKCAYQRTWRAKRAAEQASGTAA